MSRERQTSDTTQTQTVQATPEEQELNRLQLESFRATQPQQLGVQQQGLSLIGSLLAGEDLPGQFAGLTGGISEDVTSRIVQQSLEDVRPGLQKAGIFDSGIRAELETETAADIRTRSEQFNIQNLLQLLSLGIGGQAQIQQPLLGQQGLLGQSLAGQRGTTGVGTGVQTFANPFLKSLQQSAGQNLGSAAFSAGPFSFGGTA